MARAVYSRRLLAVEGLDGDLEYSVPLGFVTVVRDVIVSAGEGTAGDFRLIGDAGQTFVYWITPGGSGYLDTKIYHWTGRQVLPAGGSCVARVTGGPMDVTVSGYELAQT